MPHRFAVIGNPISHSLSPCIHQHFAIQLGLPITYEKIQGTDSHFESQVSTFFSDNGKGLNVTLPFKQRAFKMAAIHTDRCLVAGAANTLWLDELGQLNADNTDGIGFMRDIARHLDLSGKRVLILGAGGAVRGILGPLLATPVSNLIVVNRTMDKVEGLKKDFPAIHVDSLSNVTGVFDLIINATAASLAEQAITLPEQCFGGNTLCYDLAYRQEGVTAFVQYAQTRGCQAIDGLGMLVEQAAESFMIWQGQMPLTKPVLDFLRKTS